MKALLISACCFFLPFGMVAKINTASAHGDAGWIMANPQTAWCCGVEDCAPAPAGMVKETGFQTWEVQGVTFHMGDGKTFGTEPLKIDKPEQRWEYWICQPPGSPPKCLFVPPPAF